MLSLGDKVKRLRNARGLSQRELAKQAGLGFSSVAQIEQGIRCELRPSTFDKLATALRVEPTYFRTDDVREYTKARIAAFTEDELGEWWAKSTHERWKWVLHELSVLWGDEWIPGRVAERFGISGSGFESMLAGRWEMPDVLQQDLCAVTGVPFNMILNAESADYVLQKYRRIMESAHKKGISPDQLEAAINMLESLKQTRK